MSGRIAVAALFVLVAAAAAPGPVAGSSPTATPAHLPRGVAACNPIAPPFARCLANVRTDVAPLSESLVAAADASPGGLSPSDLQSAYSLPSLTAGANETVAIVDAYDQPNAAADLAAYRAQYGLAPINNWTDSSTPSPWFRKVDQSGGTSYPTVDNGWGLEISLDIQMVSAVCPNCNILLVETNSASMGDLGTGVNEAAALGATAISNSYIGGESMLERFFYDGYYNHPGIAITAASGDSGYGPGYPAASQYVTAVGGTTLTQGTSGWTETAWDGAGSGCSAYESKPAWQTDTGCGNRTIADVAAVASVDSPVAVYDSSGYGGWIQVYGTSVATPIIASVYALAGTPAAGSNPASYPYANPGALHDVTSGSNGTCSPAYLCNAVPGYDGPTGLGTPDGTAAFAAPGTSGTPPTITSASDTTFTEGTNGSFTVTTTGNPAPTLSVSGSLPNGVTFADNGDGTATLAGTPAAGTAGSYPLTITASNGNSPDATQSFTLTVDAAVTGTAPTITSASSTTFTEGTSGGFTVTTDGTPIPSLSESGSLPGGVTFTDNHDGTATLAGAPTSSGSYPITITASNGVGPDAVQDFTLTVDAAPAITSAASATFTEDSHGSFTVRATGTPTPSLSESGNLPSGVTFADNGDGTATVAGTPATGTAGSYPLTFTASNGVGSDATQSFTLTVDAAPAPGDFSLSVNPTSSSVQGGGTVQYDITITPISGFTGSVTLSVTGAPPKSKVSFSQNPATTSSTLTIRTQRRSTGDFTLTITGVSGSLTHSISTGLTVTAR